MLTFAKLLSLYDSVLCLLLVFLLKASVRIRSCCRCLRLLVHCNCRTVWKKKNCLLLGRWTSKISSLKAVLAGQPCKVSASGPRPLCPSTWQLWKYIGHAALGVVGERLTAHLNTKGLRGSFAKSSRLKGNLFYYKVFKCLPHLFFFFLVVFFY